MVWVFNSGAFLTFLAAVRNDHIRGENALFYSQIWKHKGEEFRLSGKGGVFWWSARLADEDDCDVPQSLPQSDNNTDGDVIDVSACFRSTDSKFYPVEEALREQFGDSLKELDRLMALKPEPPSPVKPVPVAKPTPAADSTEEKRSIASQDRMQNGQATEEEKDKMADEVAKEPSEDKMDVDSVTSKENAESTDVTAASEVVEENKTEGAKVDVEAKEEIAEGEKEEEKKDEPVEAKGSSTAGVVNLNSPSTVRYKALLPKLLQMSDKLDLLDFYRISHTDFFVLAINAGLSEVGSCKQGEFIKSSASSFRVWFRGHLDREEVEKVLEDFHSLGTNVSFGASITFAKDAKIWG